MSVNIVLELSILFVILIYYILSRGMNKYRDFKLKIFEGSYIFVIILILANMYVTHDISGFLNHYHLTLLNVCYSLIFLLSSIIGYNLSLYLITYIYIDRKFIKKIFNLIISIPIIILIIILIINPFNNILFTISSGTSPDISNALLFDCIIKAFYFLIHIIFIVDNWKRVNNYLRFGLFIYPIVAFITLVLWLYINRIDILVFSNSVLIILFKEFLQQNQVKTDNLIGLPPKNILFDYIVILDKKNIKYKVFFISLRNFKLLNVNYGTNIADTILINIGKYLETMVKGSHVYRYSGDEFAILFVDKTLPSCYELMHTIIERFAGKWVENGYGETLYANFGLISSEILEKSKMSSVLFIQNFLKYVKEFNEGKIIICDQQTVEKLERKEELYHAVINAIKEKSFLAYLQPIYDIKDKRFKYAEALVRLKDEKLGMVYPFEFISLAEERNLIGKIDLIMFEKGCEMLKQLEEKNININGISINFSIEIFMDANIINKVKIIMKKYNTNPKKIMIEITETTLSKSYNDVKKVMESLKNLGIQFYLDDFGIGYSNLMSVIKLPFDYIKLDKSLIDELGTNKTTEDLFMFFCEVFTQKGCEIICEGVETKEQLELLKDYGLRYIQGYLFAKPMPFEQALFIFREQKIQPLIT